MRRFWTWLLAAVAAIVLLAIAAMVALPFLVDTPRVQSLISSSAAHALGRPVRFEALSVSVFPLPALELRGLEVAEDPRFGPSPFLRLDRGRLRLKLAPLLAGRVEFGDLTLRKPSITVIQDAAGRWNFASLGAPVETRAPAPRPRSGGGGASTGTSGVLGSRVTLEDGVVTYVARGAGAGASSYRLEGLDLTLRPAPGSIGIEGSARLEPGDVTLSLAGVTVSLEGARSLTDAALRGRVSVEGREIRDLVATAAGPSPEISSGIKGTLTLAGTAGTPKASGDVALPGITVTRTSAECPEPRRRSLTLDRATLKGGWENNQLVAHPVSVTIAGGTVTANLVATVERGVRIELKDLGIKGLPLEKVLVEFLCQAYAVTGPLDFAGAFSLSPRDLWGTLSGGGQLRIGPGKVVGAKALEVLADVARLGGAISGLLGREAPAAPGSSPLEFDSITGTVRIVNGVVTTRDLLYTSRAMKVAVAGEYALASGRVNLDVVLSHGRGEIQAKVTGAAASPAIRVVPSSVLRSVDPATAESGLRELLKRFR